MIEEYRQEQPQSTGGNGNLHRNAGNPVFGPSARRAGDLLPLRGRDIARRGRHRIGLALITCRILILLIITTDRGLCHQTCMKKFTKRKSLMSFSSLQFAILHQNGCRNRGSGGSVRDLPCYEIAMGFYEFAYSAKNLHSLERSDHGIVHR